MRLVVHYLPPVLPPRLNPPQPTRPSSQNVKLVSARMIKDREDAILKLKRQLAEALEALAAVAAAQQPGGGGGSGGGRPPLAPTTAGGDAAASGRG